MRKMNASELFSDEILNCMSGTSMDSSSEEELDELMLAASQSYEDSVKATPSAEEKSRMPKKSRFAMPKSAEDIERVRIDTIPEKTKQDNNYCCKIGNLGGRIGKPAQEKKFQA